MSNQIPDFIEPIVGYRFWYNCSTNCCKIDSHLHSLNPYNHLWPIDKPMTAVPSSFSRESKSYKNWLTGGIFAFKDKERLRHSFGGIKGEVWLWGRIEEHKDGYRAEFAYPKLLYMGREEVGSTGPSAAKHLARVYGIATEEQASCTLENMLRPFMSNRWKQRHLEFLRNSPAMSHHSHPPFQQNQSRSPWALKQEELELSEEFMPKDTKFSIWDTNGGVDNFSAGDFDYTL